MLKIVGVVAVLVAAAINLLLGFLVLSRNHRNKINITFFILNLFFALWSFSLVFYEYPVVLSSIYWIQITYAIVSILIVLALVLSFIFPKSIHRKLWPLASAFSLIFLSFTAWLLFFTDHWIIDVIEVPGKGFQTLLGPGYTWWLLSIWSVFGWALYNLVYSGHNTRGLQKMQLRYLFYGFSFWGILVNIPDVIIPLFFSDTSYFVFSPLSSMAFSGAVGYSILRHRLLDIRFVLARTLSYSLLTGFIILFYTAMLFVVGRWIFPSSLEGGELIVSITLALIVAYTFQPIKKYLEHATEKLFFKQRYDPDELLAEISRVLSGTFELDTLRVEVVKRLKSKLHLDEGTILYAKDEGYMTAISEGLTGGGVVFTKHQMQLVREKDSPMVVFDDLAEGELKSIMRDNSYGVLIRLAVKDKDVGILTLGNKLSGDAYDSTDIKVLSILGPQIAVAIQNAMRYEEAKRFSEKLQTKVEEATRELKLANSKLKDLDKRKDEFISVAAHELRAPMTAIKGYLSMIAEGDAGEVTDEAVEYLEDAIIGNDRLIRLVNNMLNVARIEDGRLVYQIEDINLTTVVRTVYDEFKLEAQGKGIDLKMTVPDNIVDKVVGDEDRIHEVIANFVSNAIKYTQKGKVSIKLLQPVSTIIRCEVEDTGPGISKKDGEKLFNKFYRAESAIGKAVGSGLGLYISKLLIKEFGGKIGFTSDYGKGSVFWFELPIASVK